jgi:hypothetical protein
MKNDDKGHENSGVLDNKAMQNVFKIQAPCLT